MAKKEKTKTREITITETKGAFAIFGGGKKGYDSSGVSALRQLLSNEKARILFTIKTEKPISIYDLAKKLGRGFKSVNDDIKLLERFGFIDLIEEKTKNRKRYRPEIVVDSITIHLKV
jgi:predicted transcriptional regulator